MASPEVVAKKTLAALLRLETKIDALMGSMGLEVVPAPSIVPVPPPSPPEGETEPAVEAEPKAGRRSRRTE